MTGLTISSALVLVVALWALCVARSRARRAESELTLKQRRQHGVEQVPGMVG